MASSTSTYPILHPTAIWGQDSKFIFLTLNLADTKYATVKIKPDSLFFKANGIGASGKQDYCLDIELYKPLQPTGNSYKILGRTVEFKLLKEKAGEHWQQLCKDLAKPSWLKVDFDRFLIEESENEDANDAKKDVDKIIPDLVDAEVKKLQKQVIGQIKVGYLVFYNLLQAVFFSIITAIILNEIITNPHGFHITTYGMTITYMKFCQLLAVLEVIHPLLGIVKSGILTPAMQVFGRNVVLFLVISSEERLHNEKSIALLFLTWSIIEVVRYPQYALSTMNYPINIITWLRYTIWIPLYPIGFYLEGSIIWKSIPYYRETGYFSLSLPNTYNFSFNFPIYLLVHVAILITGGTYLYRYMLNQRSKHLKNIFGATSSKKKS